MRALETSLSRLHSSRLLGLVKRKKRSFKYLATTCQEAEKGFQMPTDHLNRGFIDLKELAFSVGQEAESDFKVTFDNLKHRFSDFIQIAFWAGQEAEYEFAVPCNY